MNRSLPTMFSSTFPLLEICQHMLECTNDQKVPIKSTFMGKLGGYERYFHTRAKASWSNGLASTKTLPSL